MAKLLGTLFAAILVINLAFADDHAVANEVDNKVEEHLNTIDGPLYTPFIERYLLDEVRNLRSEQLLIRAEVSDKIAQTRIEANDKSINYTVETMTVFFYVMTSGAALIALVGWNSLRDMRAQVETLVNKRVDKITNEYEVRLAEVEAGVKRRSKLLSEITTEFEQRMEEVERRLKERSQQIMAAQEEISRSNELHALWLRAGLETSSKARLDVYDQILKVKPDDVEAITYKADLVLENGDCEWALNLANMAIDYDEDYAYAYWQRACANAVLERPNDALKDLAIAIEKSPRLVSDLEDEEAFDGIREHDTFKNFLADQLQSETENNNEGKA